MLTRKAEAADAGAIAAIILPTIREGTTYALDADMSEAEALRYWMGSDKETFVAEDGGAIVGTYYMRPKSRRWRSARLQLRLHDKRERHRTRRGSPHVRTLA